MGTDGSRGRLFGYEIPMPESEVYIALATVAAFLPTVVVCHHLVSLVLRIFSAALRKPGSPSQRVSRQSQQPS